MPNHLDQQLGNYRLLRLLGQGGFAEVYLGEHLHLGTRAAIKVLSTTLDDDDIEQFRTEARTIAHLEHPHIVPVLDFDVEGNVPFLVMSYSPNGSLRTLHPKGSRLPLDTVGSYVSQMASALHYAHLQKIIHRDIKPENMLLDEQRKVLLSDFGIALVAQSSSHQVTQNVAGTISYMAPEHIQGQARFASDQYALGIVIYEWLCGSRPFHGSFTELCTQHLFAAPPSLCARNSALSPTVEQVVFTALAKDPKDRFGSIQAFATAFEQACQESSVIAITSETMQLTSPQQEKETEGELLHKPTPSNKTLIATGQDRESTMREGKASRPQKRGISRRTVLIGGLVTLGIGGATWWILTPHPYTYQGHSDVVNAVVWSPNGKRIASASHDGTVQVWDAANGENIYIYSGHFSAVKATDSVISDDKHIVIAWSPNGKRIASASHDGSVQVWDAANGGNVYTYRGHSDMVNAVAWSPNGKRIASATDYTVHVWDATDGGNLSIYKWYPDNWVNAVTWSPDGKRIAEANEDHSIQVWDAADGGNVYTYRGHSNAVKAVVWSPNGKRIASAGLDSTVQVWDAADGGHPYTYRGHSDWVNAVAWSPNGKRIASASGLDNLIVEGEHIVQVWDAADGGNAYTYRGHSDAVKAVAWSPNGTRIASASADHTVQVWLAP